MNNQTAQYKATEYVYDLQNAALENGFKAGESWKVDLVSTSEKLAIEKKYYPTVATKFVPEIIADAYRLVKAQLQQTIKESAEVIDKRAAPQPALQYVIAYNPDRLRR